MSADLFAEFSNLGQSPPAAPRQPHAGQAKPPPLAAAARKWARDPFSLVEADAGGGTYPTPTSPASHHWPSSQPQAGGGSGAWSSLGQPSPPAAAVADQRQAIDYDDDDGWGDFEVADSASQRAVPAAHAPGMHAQEPLPAWARTHAPTAHTTTNSLVSKVQPVQSSPVISWNQHQAKKVGAQTTPTPTPTPTDPNVLFDADDFELQAGEEGEEGEEDGDEFGDFEIGARPPTPPRPAAPAKPAPSSSMDLLGLDDTAPPAGGSAIQRQAAGKPSAPMSFGAVIANHGAAANPPSFRDRSPFPDLAVETSAAGTSGDENNGSAMTPPWSTGYATAASQASRGQAGDEWSAWDEVPVVAGAGAGAGAKDGSESMGPPGSWDWEADGTDKQSAAASQSDGDPPPTNVPPPSVILSAFPDLLNAASALLRPMGQGAWVKEQVLSNPKTVQFLRGYIALAATAARVIAGRKHRWHRDKILAKSMSMSPAGSKGMKLAGVDRTQQAREDREVADVVSACRDHVGRLRSAVAVANASSGAKLRLIELSERMQVQTAKVVPTAPNPCVICGLKREERVAKVDFDVEDSFGEWWVAHWGHRTCKNFWLEHERRLRQR